jgi:hypothetical protein
LPAGWLLPKVALSRAHLLRVLVAISAVGLLSGCGSSSRPRTLPTRSHPDLESFFEDEGLLHQNPAAALAQFKALGVDRVRVYVPWDTIAPAPGSHVVPQFQAADPAAYPAAGWSPYDQIVQAARARGIGLDFTLGGPAPVWADGPGGPKHGGVGAWKPSAPDFGAFVRAVGTRYNGSYRPPGVATPLPRVDFWSVWNEPNYGVDLAPQTIDNSTVEVSTQLYRGLLDAAWRALSATGHARDTILFGETAPRGITTGNGPATFAGMVPLRFLRALYCVDSDFRELRGAAATLRGCPADPSGSAQFARRHPALFLASGFADHPYPQGALAPNIATPGEPDYADLATLGNLERTLDRLQATYGSARRLPIYSTEFGYHTDPPEPLRPSPALAAGYLNWSEYISWRDPRVRSYDQYLMLDSPSGHFATGLKFDNGTPKATFAAFRLPLYLPVVRTAAGQPIEVWGCVRPAPVARQQSGRRQSVRIEFARGSSSRYATVRTVAITDPHGYFDVAQTFGHSGRVRLAWSYPGGLEIHSRIVNVTVH